MKVIVEVISVSWLCDGKVFMQGWLGYYRIAEMNTLLLQVMEYYTAP